MLRALVGGLPFLLGNVVSLTEAIEVDRTSRQSYKDASGGELDVEEIVSSYTFEAVVDDVTPENIALGFRGTSQELPSQVVTDEELNVWSGIAAGLKWLPDPAVAPTVAIDATDSHATDTAYSVGDTIVESGRAYLAIVAGTSDASAPTFPTDLSTVVDGGVTWKDLGDPALVAGTDFEATAHGIRILDNQSGRFSGELPIPVKVGYTRNAQYLIQALVASGLEYYIEWQGLNSVDGGNPLLGKYFRVKFSPTSGFSRHGGDDFAQLTLSASVLADESRTGQGESKYSETAMI